MRDHDRWSAPRANRSRPSSIVRSVRTSTFGGGLVEDQDPRLGKVGARANAISCRWAGGQKTPRASPDLGLGNPFGIPPDEIPRRRSRRPRPSISSSLAARGGRRRCSRGPCRRKEEALPAATIPRLAMRRTGGSSGLADPCRRRAPCLAAGRRSARQASRRWTSPHRVLPDQRQGLTGQGTWIETSLESPGIGRSGLFLQRLDQGRSSALGRLSCPARRRNQTPSISILTAERSGGPARPACRSCPARLSSRSKNLVQRSHFPAGRVVVEGWRRLLDRVEEGGTGRQRRRPRFPI